MVRPNELQDDDSTDELDWYIPVNESERATLLQLDTMLREHFARLRPLLNIAGIYGMGMTNAEFDVIRTNLASIANKLK